MKYTVLAKIEKDKHKYLYCISQIPTPLLFPTKSLIISLS